MYRIFLLNFLMIMTQQAVKGQPSLIWNVPFIDIPVQINGVWDKEPWQDLPELKLEYHMGALPEHFPEVNARIAYDTRAINVIFRVRDRYVKAVADQYQDPVYKDSCVEFFFTPGPDVNEGYFNLEMNCGGTALFHFQKVPRKDPVNISPEDFKRIDVAHTLPEKVDPEITKTVTWVVEYRIPFDMLQHYNAFEPPREGSRWRVNLYKCADDTSHPHWLTWSPVSLPEPDFHQPGHFGTLVFQ